MKITALVEAMVEAGATPEMILVAVRATEQQMTDVLEKRRASDRDRQAKKRSSHVTSRDVTVTVPSRASATRGEDKTSTQKIEPQEQEERNARKRASPASGFDEFWSLYPHKVGKPFAATKFAAALRIASFEIIMAGLRAYVAKTDDRPWCNPATWLHQQRWGDEPAMVLPRSRAGPPNRGPLDHFRDFASEINGQDRNYRSVGGDWNDAPGIPVRTIEHHG